MRPMWTLVGLVIAGAFAIILAFWAGQRSLMYLPSGHLETPSDVGLANAEALQLRTEDGLDLGAWFASSAAPTTRGTIIVFNGNAGNRSYRGTLAARLTQAGFDVLLFDYRGYGGNAGSPSEDGLAADARAARAYLARRSG